jgi:hypothetical protein
MEHSHFWHVRIIRKSPCYRPLPRIMCLTCTTWVYPWTGDITVRGKRIDHVKKHESLPLHLPLSITHHLIGVPFTTNLKQNICPALTAQNATEYNCTVVHAQNTTALQPDVFLTEIYIGYWKQTKDSRLSPTSANIDCKLHNHYITDNLVCVCVCVCIYIYTHTHTHTPQVRPSVRVYKRDSEWADFREVW